MNPRQDDLFYVSLCQNSRLVGLSAIKQLAHLSSSRSRCHSMQDRNFDDIAEKFSRNIYGTTKGRIRQAVLTRSAAINRHAARSPASYSRCWRWRRTNGV